MAKPEDPKPQVRETEELLAGFDRPGRTPRVPAVKQDFVAFHLEKAKPPRRAEAPVPRAGDGREAPTVLVPRETSPWPKWLALFAAMALAGFATTFSIFRDGGEPATAIAPSPSLIPSAEAPAPPPTSLSAAIPIPTPSSSASVAPPQRPRTPSAASPSASDPRGDFIRKL